MTDPADTKDGGPTAPSVESPHSPTDGAVPCALCNERAAHAPFIVCWECALEHSHWVFDYTRRDDTDAQFDYQRAAEQSGVGVRDILRRGW